MRLVAFCLLRLVQLRWSDFNHTYAFKRQSVVNYLYLTARFIQALNDLIKVDIFLLFARLANMLANLTFFP